MTKVTRFLQSAAIVAMLATTAPLPAATAKKMAARPAALTLPAPVDLSGFWELRADSKHVPKSELVPGYNGRMRQFNNIVVWPSRWCHPLGVPFVMGDSAPLSIVQGRTQTVITAEVQSSARHIYTDGRKQVNLDEYDFSTTGHSIGHWEGKVFVVDTIGFNNEGNRMIPGGGMRGETSHLVERFELRNNGQELNVKFTWTDPKVLAKPQTYDFTYYKVPGEARASEYFCDASDESRGGSVIPPEQDK